MPRRSRREYTAEEKADAVRLARDVGSARKAAKMLDVPSTSVSRWIKEAAIEEEKGPEGALTAAEREELRRLRRRVRTLEMECEFAKKAAAFFAKNQDLPSS